MGYTTPMTQLCIEYFGRNFAIFTTDGIPHRSWEKILVSQDLLRKEGVDRNPNDREDFNSTIHLLNLLDLPINDRLFTWSNMREHPMLARLDLVLVSSCWDAKFLRAKICTL